MALWILVGVLLLGGVAVYVFSDDLSERWSDTKDFVRILRYLPRLLREVEHLAKQQGAMPEEAEGLTEEDVKRIAVKREELRERWVKGGGTEESFVGLEEEAYKRGWLVKVKGPGQGRRMAWAAYQARENLAAGSGERQFLDVLLVCVEEKKRQDTLAKIDRASGIRSSHVEHKMVRMKEEEWAGVLKTIGIRGGSLERFQRHLLYRDILAKAQGKGNRKEFWLQKAEDLLQQERRFLWTSLGMAVAALLPFGLMYLPAFVAMLSQIAPPVALLAGVVLGSYVELSHRLEMQRGALRLGVFKDETTMRGNALQPIFIGLLLGHEQYRSSYGWGIPHRQKSWPLSSLKLELLMKIRVYVLAILSVLLVLLVSSLFARDSELAASLNPFIGYYTLLISFAMWAWVSRRGKLPVLRAKVLIYHPDEGLGKGWPAYFFEEPQTEEFLSKEEIADLQQSYPALRTEKPLFLEVTVGKSSYGFYNQQPLFRLFQRGVKKMDLDESDEARKKAFRVLNERYGLKSIKDAEVEGEPSFVEDADL